MTAMRVLATTIGLNVVVGIMAGCGGEGSNGAAAGKPGAAIMIDGSSTVFRISKAAQEDFNGVDPNVTVVVNNHGTGGGFGRYLEGEVDIVDASRLAEPEEEAKAKAQGIDWTRFTVGYDGITLVVNAKNDFVKSLTVEQLKKHLGAWKQGQDMEGCRSDLARPQDHFLFTGQRLGNIRVLHRGDRRQEEEPARRCPAEL